MYNGEGQGKGVKEFLLKNVFILGMVSLFSAVVVGYFAAISARTKDFTVDRTFYFLAVKAEAETAAVVSKSEYSYGGAGYTFTYDGVNYVGLASYNSESEARIIKEGLKNRGKETEIVELTVDTFYFTDRREVEKYEETCGFVNTALQCADLLYATANGLDSGELTQEEARRVIEEIRAVFSQAGEKGCAAVAEMTDAGEKKCAGIVSGVIYAKDVRCLQMQISEGIYNLQKVFAL